MSIKVTQIYGTMTGDVEKRTVDYLVENCGDEEQALGAVFDAAPNKLTSNPYFVLDNVSVKEVDKKAYLADFVPTGQTGTVGGVADGSVADGLYVVTAHYINQSAPSGVNTPPPPENGEPDLEDDQVRLKQHNFTQSLENVTEYTNLVGSTSYYIDDSGNPQVPVEPVRGIHPRGETGEFEGVSVRRPIGSYVISYYPSAERATQAYLDGVKALVGSVNNAPFQGYAAGEVLFISAQGSGFNDSHFDLQFTFEIRANKTNQTITKLDGSVLQFDVDGHDYSWVYYEEIVDGETIKQNPVQVIVEQLYPRADLNDLFLEPAP